MARPKLLVFASGTAHSGGLGFENLVYAMRRGALDADIIGVVSHHANGGVRHRADKLGIPFIHFRPPWSEVGYRVIAGESGADYIALSGWLKQVRGLDPRTCINIHPGPLRTFGGSGMYGYHIHEAVMAAYRCGEVTHSAICMHFVTPEYDRGPCFFRHRVKIRQNDTPETLGKRVKACEHRWQPEVTNLVVQGAIRWDGENPNSLVCPQGYKVNR